MTRRIALLTLIVLTAGLMPACTVWSTYPPMEGSSGLDVPLAPVPEIMTKGILHVAGNPSSQGQTIVFNLPPNTPRWVWNEVRIGLDPARPMSIDGEPAYHVHAVRLRATRGEVDIIHLVDDRYRLTTVRMRSRGLEGWRVESAYPWRFETSVPGPDPRFVEQPVIQTDE
jgi:hypothetical protein